MTANIYIFNMWLPRNFISTLKRLKFKFFFKKKKKVYSRTSYNLSLRRGIPHNTWENLCLKKINPGIIQLVRAVYDTN